MDLNKVMLIGRLTRDPEVRTIPSGQNVATFSIATNRQWSDRESGERKSQTEYHNIVAWRRLADIVGQYLRKGSQVYIEGYLQTRSWDDASGVKKYRTEIVTDNLIMLGSKSAGSESGVTYTPIQNGTSQPAGEPHANTSAPSPSQAPSYDGTISTDDIPF